MTINKTGTLWLTAICMIWASATGFAQNMNPSNLTASPYTRYGFGKLGTVGNASTRAMGDVGIAVRTNQYTNLYNPASLTAIDTLTLLFDVGIDAEWYTVSENGKHEQDWNAGFSYMTFHFPLWNRFAGAIAYTPYSMVGYEYGNEAETPIDNTLINSDTLVYSNTNSGSGGLQHFQLALAWEPVKTRTQTMSLGLKAGYICGTVTHSGSMYVSSGQSNSTYVNRDFSARGWDLLLGVQYSRLLSPSRRVIVGATFSPRTHIGVDSEVIKYSGTDTIGQNMTKNLSLSAPMKAGGGVTYQIDRKLTVSAEYSFENWKNVAGLDANLNKQDGVYRNITRVAAGAEYRPKVYSQSYLQTCLYRAGVSYKNSYIESYGSSNKELSVTCGVAFPTLNKRSLLSISAAYTRIQPSKSGMLSENYLHLTLGVTFNEMMFYRSRLR